MLALAEKRIPGAWVSEHSTNYEYGGIRAASDHVFLFSGSFIDAEDADFIAACAGAAEAGWRATIAACDMLLGVMARYQMEPPETALAHGLLTAWEGLV